MSESEMQAELERLRAENVTAQEQRQGRPHIEERRIDRFNAIPYSPHAALATGREGGSLTDGFDIYGDFHLIADQDAA